jgi:hypothetical protein
MPQRKLCADLAKGAVPKHKVVAVLIAFELDLVVLDVERLHNGVDLLHVAQTLPPIEVCGG